MNKIQKEIFEMEQELGVPSHLRWHNTKPKKVLTDYINKETSKQEQNGLTPMDLIEFSKWVNKMGYSHRLTLIPNDLIDFYLTNRENIIKLNLE
jgi:hypothetical protein